MTTSFFRAPNCASASNAPRTRIRGIAARVLCGARVSDVNIGEVNSGQLFGVKVPGPKGLFLIRTHRASEFHDVPACFDIRRRPDLELRAGYGLMVGKIGKEYGLGADQRKAACKPQWITES